MVDAARGTNIQKSFCFFFFRKRRLFLRMSALTVLTLLTPSGSNAQTSYTSIAQAWAAAWSHKQAPTAAALYAEDADFYHATGERVHGRAAIAALFAQVLAKNSPNIEMSSVTRAQAGPVAWDSGTYRETIVPVAGGAAVSLHGRYLLVLQKDRGGAWLIKSMMWSDGD